VKTPNKKTLKVQPSTESVQKKLYMRKKAKKQRKYCAK